MTTFYWDEAIIPCCNRRVFGACIERLQSIAARENKPVCKTIFVTRELLEYEVKLDHGAKKTWNLYPPHVWCVNVMFLPMHFRSL